MKKIMVMGIGKDRPGIVSEVTRILYGLGASIEDSSMTILEGNFAMIMIVAVPKAKLVVGVRKLLEPLKKKLQLTVDVEELQEKPKVGPSLHKGIPYIASVLGEDRPGIVHRVSSLLAKERVNITDLNTKVIGREGGRNVYAMVLELEIPAKGGRAAKVEKALRKLGRSLRLDISFRAIENITC